MNWQDIDTSTPEGLRQLDAIIALRLGLLIPQGNVRGDEREIWTLNSDDPNDTQLWRELKRYTTDLNTAAALPFNLPEQWHFKVVIYSDGEIYAAVLNINDIAEVATTTYEGRRNEALARCIAWLYCKDHRMSR